MTTQTIVFIIAYLIGIAVAFRAGKQFWKNKFLNGGYVLMDLRTLNALSKASEDLCKHVQKLAEEQTKEIPEDEIS